MPRLPEECQQVVRRRRSEDFAGVERALEGGAAQVGEQDVEVVGVRSGLLGAAVEEELGVDLVERTPPGAYAVAVAELVTREEKRAVVSLYPTVFTLVMLSDSMPIAWACAAKPDTPENRAP